MHILSLPSIPSVVTQRRNTKMIREGEKLAFQMQNNRLVPNKEGSYRAFPGVLLPPENYSLAIQQKGKIKVTLPYQLSKIMAIR